MDVTPLKNFLKSGFQSKNFLKALVKSELRQVELKMEK